MAANDVWEQIANSVDEQVKVLKDKIEFLAIDIEAKIKQAREDEVMSLLSSINSHLTRIETRLSVLEDQARLAAIPGDD